MTTQDKQTNQALKLPERMVTTVDLHRSLRELKRLDDWMRQAALRSPGQSVQPPKTSATLEELAAVNGVSLLHEAHRAQLIGVLEGLSEHAPKVHMSFAVEPSAAFLNSMIVWLRANISPLIMLQIGLQPTLAAGCTLRTTNKMFDMSLRHRFVESRGNLVAAIASVEEANTDPLIQGRTSVEAVSSASETTQETSPENTDHEAAAAVDAEVNQETSSSEGVDSAAASESTPAVAEENVAVPDNAQASNEVQEQAPSEAVGAVADTADAALEEKAS